jgi:hypothetical protein
MDERKHGVIDNFTVFYCIVSSLLTIILMAVFDVAVFNWWQALLVLGSPFLLDCILTVVITGYVVMNKTYLMIRKRIHEKKNPPEKF